MSQQKMWQSKTVSAVSTNLRICHLRMLGIVINVLRISKRWRRFRFIIHRLCCWLIWRGLEAITQNRILLLISLSLTSTCQILWCRNRESNRFMICLQWVITLDRCRQDTTQLLWGIKTVGFNSMTTEFLRSKKKTSLQQLPTSSSTNAEVSTWTRSTTTKSKTHSTP